MEFFSAISSIAYPLVGWYIFKRGFPYIAATTGLLGIGSFSYHFWLTRPVQYMDEIGMYFVFTALLFALLRIQGWRIYSFIIALALSLFAGILSSFVVLGVLFVCISALKIIKHNPEIGMFMFFVFATAFTAWLAGRDPFIDELHTMWHIITAYGIFIIVDEDLIYG